MPPTDQPGSRSHDALLLAARGAPAALLYVLDVQSSLGDIDAALDAAQWPVSIAASCAALRSVVHCRMVLSGLTRAARDDELDLHLALGTGDCADVMSRIAAAGTADRDTAISISKEVREIAARLESELPFTLPVIRTPRGYFPSVRMGKDLAALREHLGLSPLDWMEWM